MKKSSMLLKILLLVAYCVPYSFLAVNGDGTSGTMLFYGVMIAAFVVLCTLSIKTHNAWIIVVDSFLSGVSSYLTASLSGLEPMGHYFKPFTSHGLITTVSVIAFVVQTAIVLICLSKQRKEKIKEVSL